MSLIDGDPRSAPRGVLLLCALLRSVAPDDVCYTEQQQQHPLG